jgi:hypothetical protein
MIAQNIIIIFNAGIVIEPEPPINVWLNENNEEWKDENNLTWVN